MLLARVNTMVGARNFVDAGVLANAAVLVDRLGARVTPSVIEVDAAAAITYLAGFNAHVYQAFSELTILSAILHSLVESIGCKNMLFPGG